jgi:GNAT superfamily N-acetyltransferase
MNLLWQSFLRNAARQAKAGSIRDLGGVEAAWVHSALLINNATYLTRAVAGEGELRERFRRACADAGAHELPWVFYLYKPYAESVGDEPAAALAAEFGLAPMMEVEVMLADASKLGEPARPLPEVEFRRVQDQEGPAAAIGINMRAYAMPEFMGESVLEAGAYYRDPAREFGYVAYSGGTAVSTATVVELDGWLYVALVATDPEHRQKGYAEAVMRHALRSAASELGITRTALDATEMGAPLYAQMGFERTGERWSMYVPVA